MSTPLGKHSKLAKLYQETRNSWLVFSIYIEGINVHCWWYTILCFDIQVIWNIPHRNVFISCCEFFTPGYVSYFWNSESSNEQKMIVHYKKFGIAPYFKNLLLHLLQVILNPSYFTVIFDELLNKFFRKEQMRFNLLGWGICVSSH